MKMISRQFIVILAVTTITVLFAQSAGGQQQSQLNSGLPASLPMGSSKQFRDYIVTLHRCDVVIMLKYTNTQGKSVSIGGGLGDLGFASYADLKEFVRTNAPKTLSFLKKQTDINSTIRFYFEFGYHGLPLSPIIIDIDIGPLSGITESAMDIESICNNNSSVWEVAIVPVVGLEVLTINVNIPGSYPYVWTWPQSSIKPQSPIPPASMPPELTQSDTIFLNRWYSTNGYWARFVVSANGQSATYTQDGAMLVSPRLSITSNKVLISMTTGSDTVIESSIDFLEWEPVETFPWSAHSNTGSLSLTTTDPARFYRVKSE